MSQLRGRRLATLRIIAILVVVGLSLAILALPEEQLGRLEAFGYPGLFLVSVLSNATILIPAPGWLIVVSMGARFSLPVVALVAGAGSALGEMSGYLAGFSGQAVIEDQRIYQRMVVWMQRNGPLTVLLLSALPNPFFDIAGIAAGALRMPVRRFLLWCFFGKVIKMGMLAAVGAGLLGFEIPGINLTE